MVALAQRVAHAPIATRQFAHNFIRVHARLLAESERAERRIESALAQPLAHMCEKVVAGIGQSLRQIEWRIADRMRADNLKIVVGVARPALMAEFAVNKPRAQRGQSGERFDRRTRRESLFKSDARIDDCAKSAGLRINYDDRAFAIA